MAETGLLGHPVCVVRVYSQLREWRWHTGRQGADRHRKELRTDLGGRKTEEEEGLKEGRGGKLKVSRPLTEGKNSRTGRTEEEEEGYLRNEMNSAGVSEWVTP